MSGSLEERIAQAQRALGALAGQREAIEAGAAGLIAALRQGRKVLACGNGGSAAQAMHLVAELVGRFRADRASLPAVQLGGDAVSLSCLANDFSWEEVFTRPLRALAQPGDVLVCFSTSGNSRNVVGALGAAREAGLQSLALLGSGGGRARSLATWEILVDSSETGRVQEVHQFLVHWLCEQIDLAFASPQ